MSSPEEKTEKLMKVLLMDLDNANDVQETQETESESPMLRIWKTFIPHTAYWKKLIGLSFDDAQGRSYFESLNGEQIQAYFTFGVACLVNFVQVNVTGPSFPKHIEEYLNSDFLKNNNFSQLLTVNNEEINVNTKYPCLLVAAKYIFKHCKLMPLLNCWWQWRSIIIHQQVLDELSPTLLSQADNLQKDIKSLSIEGHLRAKFEIEQAQLYILYRNCSKAETHIKIACDILGLQYNLVGKLGKRTRYQEKDLAQLSLEVALIERENIERPPVHKIKVPHNVALQDDIRIDAISFLDNTKHNMLFPNTEQKLLLTIVQHMRISTPVDALYYEELKPFIDVILCQNNTWSVRTATLFLRSKLEAKHNRTIERSLSQCEEIVNSINSEDPHPLLRIGGVYGTGMQPTWQAEALYADLLLSVGLKKESIDIYLKLQLWEEVIVCYTLLNLRHEATEVVKEQLEKNPTVKLWCLLGDATNNVGCYERAWEMSKRRSHRAQRHWGQHYYMKKEYQQCIPHFEKSVSINPLQSIVWLRLGFAALETENWQVAATAYRRYTTLEPDVFEAWNNLAQAYLKLGNKRCAFHALKEAIRCDYENWKVWENFLFVSSDISSYSDMVRAYHRLIELKQKYLNTEMLDTLVYGVCNNVLDFNSQPAGNLTQKTRELLGRVTALYPADGYLWELYASLAPDLTLQTQRLQRAYRGYTKGNWNKSIAMCRQVLIVCHKLAECALSDEVDCKDTLVNSVRLNLSSALAAIKKQEFEQLKNLMQEVAHYLAKLIEKNKLGVGRVEPEASAK